MTNLVDPIHFHVTWQGEIKNSYMATQECYTRNHTYLQMHAMRTYSNITYSLDSFTIKIDNAIHTLKLEEYQSLPHHLITRFTFSDNTFSIQLEKSAATTVAISITALEMTQDGITNSETNNEVYNNNNFSVCPGGYYTIDLRRAYTANLDSLGNLKCNINNRKPSISDLFVSVVASGVHAQSTYERALKSFQSSLTDSSYTENEIAAFDPPQAVLVNENDSACCKLAQTIFEKSHVIRAATAAGQPVLEQFEAKRSSLQETQKAIGAFSSIVARVLTYKALAELLIEQQKYEEAREVIALIPDGQIIGSNNAFDNPKTLLSSQLKLACSNLELDA